MQPAATISPVVVEPKPAPQPASTQATSAQASTIPALNPRTGKPRRGSKGIPWRVAAVTPCFGKHKDVEKLLADLGKLDLRGIELWVTIVDNNTPVPISTVPVPPNVVHEHVRMTSNTGGAGGFNAGMLRVMNREGLTANYEQPDFLWLLDSDVRVARKSLRALIKALVKNRKKACAAGSSLVDPKSGTTFEIGGRIDRQHGRWGPMHWGDHDRRGVLPCDYVAACSMLVWRDAVEQTGVMPDIFIHGDDVRWGLELARATRKRILAVPGSRAFHPRYEDKWGTWVRYYASRNHLPPMEVLRLGPLARMRHGLHQTARSIGQTMMGLDILSDLHLQGLEDGLADATKNTPPKPLPEIIKAVATKPLAQLETGLNEAIAAWKAKHNREPSLYVHPMLIVHPHDFADIRTIVKKLGRERVGISKRDVSVWKRRHRSDHPIKDALGAGKRAIFGASADIAIVPTGWPSAWLRANTLIQVTPDAFLVREVRPWDRIAKAFGVAWRGTKLSLRLALRGNPPQQLPRAK
jgi:GT2 family glycosyltransferase